MSEQRVLIVRRACAQIDQVARSSRARVTIFPFLIRNVGALGFGPRSLVGRFGPDVGRSAFACSLALLGCRADQPQEPHVFMLLLHPVAVAPQCRVGT